ncbi:MAG: ribosome-associated translation inhibitor RaiA [Candidatus Vogelbacteria bacterium]|jgi:putative sigma-54 modulation protein|nr:ribosome-associated translation inhibitor RaiA [Candidatus Vogelbacteria bacterium]
MRLNIKATGMELTGALRQYVENKVGYLEKFVNPNDASAIAEVEISKVSNHHKSGDIFRAEINLTRAGTKLVREEVTDEDMYAAIDMVKDALIETLSSEANKKITLFRKGGRAIKNLIKGWKSN